MNARDTARTLRRRMTDGETVLWAGLRRHSVARLQFRRQHPIGPFIADFYSPSVRLIIEVDGSIHTAPGRPAYDAMRNAYLENLGLRVVRFSNQDVLTDLPRVLSTIEELAAQSTVPPRKIRGSPLLRAAARNQ